MNKSLEKTLVAAGLLAAIFAGVNALLADRTHLLHLDALAPFAAWSAVLAAIAATHARLARRAREEKQDQARATDSSATGALFSAGDTQPFSAARTLEQLERFVLPALSLLLAAGLGAWAWRLLTADFSLAPAPQNPLPAAAFLLGEAFALFLFSRYLIGLARSAGASVARAPGIALGLFTLAAGVGAIAAIAAHLEWTALDLWLARALAAIIALLAAEQLFLFLVSLYVSHRRRTAPIESRIGAWLTDPAAWTRDLAASLDYQFGVQAGHGAMMRFLRRALLPLLAVQALLLYALSCFVFIGPEEEGIRERWGRPLENRWHLASGFHLKAPWPFETVQRMPARRILQVQAGFAPHADEQRPDMVLWTVPHYREEDVFVTATRAASGDPGDAGSVSLVSVNIPVEYRITNLLAHAYRHSEPAALLRDLAYRALTRALARRDLLDLLGADRLAVSDEIREELQRESDAVGLGVEILFVGLQGIHPPVLVAEAFQSVVGALEQKEATILGARAYAASVGPRTAAEAERRRLDAEANRVALRERAAAEAVLFDRLRGAQASAPGVLRQDLHLTALAESLAGRNFAILAHRGARRVLYFNLEKPAFPELYELAPLSPGDVHP
ncbi:MAG TPA: SPFH domain-containing protein [Kiritimatiellia bacterium]|nr:SPFH domain-containing protein [Kiritimatiellia bacterium]